MLTTLVALIVALGSIVGYNLRTYHYNLISDMATQSELLGHMTAPALSFDDKQLATQNLNLLKLRPKVRAAALYNSRGEIFATYTAAGEPANFPHVAIADEQKIEGRNLVVSKRILTEGELNGTVYLRADYELVDRLMTHLSIAVLVIILAMTIAFFLSMRLQKVISEPIQAIASIAQEVVEQRDYSRRAQKMSSDEVGTLVDSFNNMLSEIQRRTQALETSNQDIAREINERRLIQQEVMHLNSALEDRVKERTSQLETSNAELEQARAAAENANQAKSAFLSSMSHELRTPLNAVLGFTQLLLVNPASLTPERIEEFSNHILKAGEHLLVLINEVLDLAKVESGTMTLSMEPVAVSDVLEECQQLIEPLAAQRNINLFIPRESQAYVFADRTRLKQVLLNLLSNAIKYNRDRGTVSVELSSNTEGYIRMAVHDSGLGLTEKQMQQLFQPFNRLGQEAGVEEGTGIGLVVTKRLLELMGGRIGVASEAGKGSTFWVELKCLVSSSAAVSPQLAHANTNIPVSRQDSSLHTVLYVEDNPVNLKLVEEVMTFRSDVRLLTAADGRLGVELARAHLPDVILLDINLPNLSGNEVFKILRKEEKTRDIPIIAVTANAMPREIEKGLALGFFRYITKPINVSELLNALDSAIESLNINQQRDSES
ncbi:MAG TPA: ATP-binding protein [Rhodocyclaceae bacterium]|nr:ATP-binding protein [Rhodocyclaceae bacterium]